MTTQFNEADHPRGSGGQFATKAHGEQDALRPGVIHPPTFNHNGVIYGSPETALENDRCPTSVGVHFDRPIDDIEAGQVSGIISYAERAHLNSGGTGTFERVDDSTFVVYVDTTRTRRSDQGQALEDFETAILDWMQDGTPVRSTDRSGPGSAGTSAVNGIVGADMKLYYDIGEVDDGPERLASPTQQDLANARTGYVDMVMAEWKSRVTQQFPGATRASVAADGTSRLRVMALHYDGTDDLDSPQGSEARIDNLPLDFIEDHPAFTRRATRSKYSGNIWTVDLGKI